MSHRITFLHIPLLSVREIVEIIYEILRFHILINKIWIERYLGLAESEASEMMQEWHKTALNTDPQMTW
jgi:hypothetical protein